MSPERPPAPYVHHPEYVPPTMADKILALAVQDGGRINTHGYKLYGSTEAIVRGALASLGLATEPAKYPSTMASRRAANVAGSPSGTTRKDRVYTPDAGAILRHVRLRGRARVAAQDDTFPDPFKNDDPFLTPDAATLICAGRYLEQPQPPARLPFRGLIRVLNRTTEGIRDVIPDSPEHQELLRYLRQMYQHTEEQDRSFASSNSSSDNPLLLSMAARIAIEETGSVPLTAAVLTEFEKAYSRHETTYRLGGEHADVQALHVDIVHARQELEVEARKITIAKINDMKAAGLQPSDHVVRQILDETTREHIDANLPERLAGVAEKSIFDREKARIEASAAADERFRQEIEAIRREERLRRYQQQKEYDLAAATERSARHLQRDVQDTIIAIESAPITESSEEQFERRTRVIDMLAALRLQAASDNAQVATEAREALQALGDRPETMALRHLNRHIDRIRNGYVTPAAAHLISAARDTLIPSDLIRTEHEAQRYNEVMPLYKALVDAVFLHLDLSQYIEGRTGKDSMVLTTRQHHASNYTPEVRRALVELYLDRANRRGNHNLLDGSREPLSDAQLARLIAARGHINQRLLNACLAAGDKGRKTFPILEEGKRQAEDYIKRVRMGRPVRQRQDGIWTYDARTGTSRWRD